MYIVEIKIGERKEMKYDSFKQLERDYSIPYLQEKYREALTILEEGVKVIPHDEFEKYKFEIMLDKVRLYCKSEMYDESINTIDYMIECGFVFPLHWSRFERLRQDERYEELREKNNKLRAKLQGNVKFKYSVYLPENYTKDKKYPVFFNLHGDGENMEFHNELWKADIFLKRGFIVVCIQSPQLIKHNGYAWLKTDCNGTNTVISTSHECYELFQQDVEGCYEFILRQYSIDNRCIIIGGFSGGAAAALEATLRNMIPVKGFITLCLVKPKGFNKENVRSALDRGVKGVLIEGEDDIDSQVEGMIKEFNNVAFPYKYYVDKGVGHWYPEDLEEKLEQALNFILS